MGEVFGGADVGWERDFGGGVGVDWGEGFEDGV